MSDDSPETHAKIAAFLEATFESIDQGITIYDENFRLVAWNRRYEEMPLGMDARFFRYGASLYDVYEHTARRGVFGPGDPKEQARERVDALRDGPLIHTEMLHGAIGARIRIRRFRLPNGGICATFRDVTEELRVESQLRHTQKMDAIGKLTGGIAHDLNNILSVIIGNLELTVTALLDDEDRESLRDALDAANRGAQLTHRLLAFARRQPLSPEILEIEPLLQSVSRMLRRVLGATIELTVDTDLGLWPCKLDRVQLESSVINLAVNARDAMPDGGRLQLEACNASLDEAAAADLEVPSGEYVVVTLTDSGTGMPPQVIEQAFDPFFTTKRVGKGTGLGLSMVHGFVRQSGGGVQIESEVGRGTTVRMYLPRTTAGSSPSSAPRSHAPAPAVNDQLVLVVEDDARLRSLLLRQLHTLGYQTLEAASGEAALEVFARNPDVSLLLTDVVLPGDLTGRDVAEAVAEARPELPTVFMSGYTHDVIGDDGWIEGATLLQKPFRIAELSRVLRAKLEG